VAAEHRTQFLVRIPDHQDVAAIGTGNKQALFGAFSKYLIRSVKDLYVLRLYERFGGTGPSGFFWASPATTARSLTLAHIRLEL